MKLLIIYDQVSSTANFTFAQSINLERIILNAADAKLANVKIYGPSLAYFSSQTLQDIPDSSFADARDIEIDCPNVKTVGELSFSGTTCTLNLPELRHIAPRAFRFADIPSVSFGRVEMIGDEAFWNAYIESVSLPAATVISFRCFFNCVYLAEVDLPNVVEICNNSFTHCASLVRLKVPRLAKIGHSSFSDCLILRSFTSCATLIADSAFYQCGGLTTVVITSSNVEIGSQAFMECQQLSSFEAKNVTLVSASAFSSCSALATVHGIEHTTFIGAFAFHHSLLNTSFTFHNLLDVEQNAFENTSIVSVEAPKLIRIDNTGFASCVELETMHAPSVKQLGTFCFVSCRSLLEVSFPLVEEIPNYAFYECFALTTANMPSCKTIGVSAFESTPNMTSFVGNIVEFVGTHAFLSSEIHDFSFQRPNITIKESAFAWTKIRVVYMDTNSVEESAFAFTRDLRSVTIYSLETIPYRLLYESGVMNLEIPQCSIMEEAAFSQCIQLKDVTMSKCTVIGVNAFFECHNLTLANFHECQFILDHAFAHCKSLCTLHFPQLKMVTSHVFYDCTSLGNITFPNVIFMDEFAFAESGISTGTFKLCTNAGVSCFENCHQLTKLSIPKLHIAQSNVFRNCTQLTTLEHKVSEIRSFAFADCPKLNIRKIESATIMEYAFANSAEDNIITFNRCTFMSFALSQCAFSGVIVKGGMAAITAFKECTRLTSVEWSETNIPAFCFDRCGSGFSCTISNCAVIGPDAFLYSNITTLDIQSQNISIEENAFGHCQILSTVTFSGVGVLYSHAFANSPKLVSLKGACTLAGQAVFANCESLKTLTLGTDNIPSLTFQACSSLAEIDLSGIKSINFSAFVSCTSLVNISGPVVSAIGDDAFSKCSNLETVFFPCLEQIGINAFSNCNITAVDFPLLNELSESVFLQCANLVTASFGYVTSIPKGAFMICKKLRLLESTADKFDFASEYSFQHCESLLSIKVDAVSHSTFHSCTNLVRVEGKLTKIDTFSFFNCRSLEAIDISQIRTIPASAFQNCHNMVIDELNVVTIEDYGLFNCSKIKAIRHAERISSYGCAFCTGIVELHLPNLSMVGSYAFAGMTSLTTFSADSLLSVNSNGTFRNCVSLVSVSFPNLESALVDTFEGCTNLSEVALGKTPPDPFPTLSGGNLRLANVQWYAQYNTAGNMTWHGLRLQKYKSEQSIILTIVLATTGAIALVCLIAFGALYIRRYYLRKLSVYEERESLSMRIIADFG